MRRISFYVLLPLASVACGAGVDSPAPAEEDVTAAEAAVTRDPSSADTRRSLAGPSFDDGAIAVRASGLGLSVDAVALRRRAAGDVSVVVKGRATRNLESVQSYVPDDGFGDARLTGKRTFEVALRDGHEINTILSGLPLYLHLDVAPSSGGAPTQYDAALELSPVLEGVGAHDGSVSGALAPVFGRDADNPLLYRARVRSGPGLRLEGPAAPTAVRSDEEGAVLVDWSYDALAPALAPKSGAFVFEADGAADRAAQLSVRVGRLGLTSVGTTAAWPELVCSPSVFRCARGLPASAPDYERCGTYRAVAVCAHADACEVLGAP